MGEEVEAQELSRPDRARYREKVRRCLDVFARMLRDARAIHVMAPTTEVLKLWLGRSLLGVPLM